MKKCSRCKKIISEKDWTYSQCPSCREYNYKKRHDLSDTDLEKIVIKQLIDVETAWIGYKRLSRKMKTKPLSKDKFTKDYMESQKIQIADYKRFLAKYKTESLPLHSTDCLKFRGMLADRNSSPTRWQPKNDELLNIWLNHTLRCSACSSWFIQHKNDSLLTIPASDEGVSQNEFDKSLDGFFGEVLQKSDSFEAIERGMGLNDCCLNCGQPLIQHDGKSFCVNCDPEQ